MDVQTAIARCIAELSASDNTKRAYGLGLDRFLDYLVENNLRLSSPLRQLKIDHFINFLAWLNQRYSKQTVGTYGAASKALFDWLVLAGIFRPDYYDALRIKKANQRSHRRHEDKLPRWPQKDDVEKMLKTAHSNKEKSPIRERNIALIELLASSGCRISEIMMLDVGDISLETSMAVVMGKGSKERRVYFSESTMLALLAYWKARGEMRVEDPILARHDRAAKNRKFMRMTTAMARIIVRQIAILAGIDPAKFTPHYFRHAFAIRILTETNNLALAQDLLGHQDPKSTRVYAKIYPDELQAAHREIFK